VPCARQSRTPPSRLSVPGDSGARDAARHSAVISRQRGAFTRTLRVPSSSAPPLLALHRCCLRCHLTQERRPLLALHRCYLHHQCLTQEVQALLNRTVTACGMSHSCGIGKLLNLLLCWFPRLPWPQSADGCCARVCRGVGSYSVSEPLGYCTGVGVALDAADADVTRGLRR
jgi:hypothetical protein